MNVYGYKSSDNTTDPYFLLYKNKNALSATYLGNKNMSAAASPFEIVSKPLTVDMAQQQYQGMPVFSAQISGVSAVNGTAPYFYADFNAQSSIVWSVNCTQALGNDTTSSCSDAPTYMQTGFAPTTKT